jgi:hypothetical protein
MPDESLRVLAAKFEMISSTNREKYVNEQFIAPLEIHLI